MNFRSTYPKRTYSGPTLGNYRGYRNQLRIDFSYKCGYSDISERFLFDTSIFHIDHFRPKAEKFYPHLENDYNNLVYASCYINRSKSDDWHGDERSDDDGTKGYLDPCNVNYNDHFYRNRRGEIIPKADSPIACYMYKRLKLYLKRFSILWMLDQIDDKLKIIEDCLTKLESSPDPSIDIMRLKSEHSDMSRIFHNHLRKLHYHIYEE